MDAIESERFRRWLWLKSDSFRSFGRRDNDGFFSNFLNWCLWSINERDKYVRFEIKENGINWRTMNNDEVEMGSDGGFRLIYSAEAAKVWNIKDGEPATNNNANWLSFGRSSCHLRRSRRSRRWGKKWSSSNRSRNCLSNRVRMLTKQQRDLSMRASEDRSYLNIWTFKTQRYNWVWGIGVSWVKQRLPASDLWFIHSAFWAFFDHSLPGNHVSMQDDRGVTVRGLYHSYGSTPVLTGLNMNVAAGSIYGENIKI